jgi:hypothetical protein
MDLVIELTTEGRIWVAARDGTVLEEAWVPRPEETPTTLRQSGRCLLEEKYTPGRWASTTLARGEIADQLWVEAPQEARH